MKNRVWIFNHYASDMYNNEGGRHFWFAKELIKQGYEPIIFCANTFHTTKNKVEMEDRKFRSLEKKGVKFVFLNTKDYKLNGIDRINNMYSFYRGLVSNYKEFSSTFGKPNIIYASSVHPLSLVAGIKISKKLEIPCISEVRDLWPEAIFNFSRIKEKSIIGKLLIQGEKWIYQKSDALIFTKEGDIDYLREKGWIKNTKNGLNREKIYYINNGVNLKEFDLLKQNDFKDEDLDSMKFKVVYTGSLRPVNDLITIVEVADNLKNYSNIMILIYGDGIQHNELQKIIDVKKLTNIKLKGSVNKKRIPYILSKSDCNLLHYSENLYNWERGNSSNKLFEYLASGKPIISTVKMGYSIIKNYNCGIESEENTSKAISKSILYISNLDEKELKEISDNARNSSLEFDYELLTKKLITIIEDTERKC